tara:strand:+ start:320 stop:475 length:156 start_codon:yes stop_codon:yes gene_type:complete
MKSIQIYQIWVNDQPMNVDLNLSQAINAYQYYKSFYRNVKIIDTTITKEKK